MNIKKIGIILLCCYIWGSCTSPQRESTATQNGSDTVSKVDLSKHNEGYSSPKTYDNYKLIWSDEFNGSQLDTNAWSYRIGTGSNGWGNNELEYYTNRKENLFLSSGLLTIEARKEKYRGQEYTSARIATQNKKIFTYGRVDIRAKLPVGQGIWPALWMLGNNISSVGWPACGEIDIMEMIGKTPKKVYGTLHWKKKDSGHVYETKSDSLATGDFSMEFHVFSLLRSQDTIKILLDNHPFYEKALNNLSAENRPFKKPFYLVFNVAVGGNWPGPPDSTTQFPKRMYVYVFSVFYKN